MSAQPPDYPARKQHYLEGLLQGEYEQDDNNERDGSGDHDEQTRTARAELADFRPARFCGSEDGCGLTPAIALRSSTPAPPQSRKQTAIADGGRLRNRCGTEPIR
jgi:hypothetical protein